ncbi:MAG: thiamine pyrophosphate-dependent enzyme, partial [Ardenticatenia bacterium]|nr:thiamine pyrophosphate-dependent enzyme [Ardenticatenia bacterium]
AGYGMPGIVVDGTNVLEVYAAAKEAVERARAGEGPTFIEAKCERLYPHTSNDDDRHYRSPEEREAAKRRDPVLRFRRYLQEVELWSEDKEAELESELLALVEEAIEYAMQCPDPRPEDAARHVYADEAILGADGYL